MVYFELTSSCHAIAGLTVSSESSPVSATYQIEKLKLGPQDWMGTILKYRQGKKWSLREWRSRKVSFIESFFRPLK